MPSHPGWLTLCLHNQLLLVVLRPHRMHAIHPRM